MLLKLGTRHQGFYKCFSTYCKRQCFYKPAFRCFTVCFNHISIRDLKANTLVLNEINQLSECFYCDIIVPLLSNDIHFSDIIFGLCCFMFFIQVLFHEFITHYIHHTSHKYGKFILFQSKEARNTLIFCS